MGGENIKKNELLSRFVACVPVHYHSENERIFFRPNHHRTTAPPPPSHQRRTPLGSCTQFLTQRRTLLLSFARVSLYRLDHTTAIVACSSKAIGRVRSTTKTTTQDFVFLGGVFLIFSEK